MNAALRAGPVFFLPSAGDSAYLIAQRHSRVHRFCFVLYDQIRLLRPPIAQSLARGVCSLLATHTRTARAQFCFDLASAPLCAEPYHAESPAQRGGPATARDQAGLRWHYGDLVG